MTIKTQTDIWRKRRWVTVAELAKAMEVSPRTVRNWWSSGKTPLRAWMPHPDIRFMRFTAESAVSFILGGFVEVDMVEGDSGEVLTL